MTIRGTSALPDTLSRKPFWNGPGSTRTNDLTLIRGSPQSPKQRKLHGIPTRTGVRPRNLDPPNPQSEHPARAQSRAQLRATPPPTDRSGPDSSLATSEAGTCALRECGGMRSPAGGVLGSLRKKGSSSQQRSEQCSLSSREPDPARAPV